MTKLLSVSFLLLLVWVDAHSQTVATRWKFDEFSLFPRVSSPLVDRGNRLARHMLNEAKTRKAAIVFYNERKGMFPLVGGREAAEYTKGILVNGYSIRPDRIIIVDGGHRENATLEYWIVEDDGALPNAIPTVKADETVICPEVNIAGDGFRHDRSQPLRFSTLLKGTNPAGTFTLRWTVSAGRIVDGNGTPTILVDLTDSKDRRVTAGLFVEGLPVECENYYSSSTEVGMFAYKYAEIQYNYSYFAAIVDGLMSELSVQQSLHGVVIFYAPRTGGARELEARILSARNHVRFRRFDPMRISFVNGGHREEASVEFFLVPAGVQHPTPSPTVDATFVRSAPIKKRKGRGQKE
ncbi:MAG: hypothetical protein ABI857_10230 [Acidobacteriota bacterium]